MSRSASPRRRGTGFTARLVAFCVVVATASIGTTAWIAVANSSSSIKSDYSHRLASIASVYERLSGYAATHASWQRVGALVATLSRTEKTRVTLKSPTGHLIADSEGMSSPLSTGDPPVAEINPLEPELSVGRVSLIGGIDARVVGPFALRSAQRAKISAAVRADRRCYTVRTNDPAPPVTTFPNGREFIALPAFAGVNCPKQTAMIFTTASERRAAMTLVRAVARCVPEAKLRHDGSLTVRTRPGSAGGRGSVVELDPWYADFQGQLERLVRGLAGSRSACVAAARRAQMTPFVAPPAQLYLSAAAALSAPRLSSAGVRRVALAGAVILLLTIAVCVVAAATMRRPLAVVTGAVQATASGARDKSVPVRGTAEMRDLAVAVNELSAQLAAADQRRRDMTSDVAHELRAPLANIRGWLEAVQEHVAEPDAALMSRLLGEAVQLQRLVDELQDLALADAGQLPVHPEEVDVRDYIEQAVVAARATAPSGVQVIGSVEGDTRIRADPVRLGQILANLLSNALRATRHGSVTVHAAGADDGVRIDVTDTGVGISPEDLPYVFDRFWRADRSRNRTAGGSGLGMAITQSFVIAHKGTIGVVSEVGRGTTVTVQLPRDVVAEGDEV